MTGGNDSVLIAPDALDGTSVVGVLGDDALSGLSNVPDDEVGISTDRGDVGVIRRPGDGVDGGGVEDPSGGDASLSLPGNNFTVGITSSEVSSVGRVGEGSDFSAVLTEIVLGVQRASRGVQGKDVDLLVLSSNGDLSGRGVDGDSGGHVILEGSTRGDLVTLDDEHLVTTNNDSDVSDDSETVGLHIESDGLTEGAVGDGGDLDSIVHRDGVEVVTRDDGGRDLSGVLRTSEHLSVGSGSVPLQQTTLEISGVDLIVGTIITESSDALVVTTNDLLGLIGVGEVQEVEETREGDGDDLTIGTVPDATELLILSIRTESEGSKALEGSSIPQLGSLVGRDGQDLSRIGRPGSAINTGLVTLRLQELSDLVSSLTIEDEARLVGRDRDELLTVGGETSGVNEALMLLEGLLELEGRSLEKVERQILRTSDHTIRTSLLQIDSVDSLGVARNLSNRSSSIGENNSSELLLSLTNNSDTLAVITPGHILNGSSEKMELILQDMLGLSGVPNANLTRSICSHTDKPSWKQKEAKTDSAHVPE